MGFKETNRSSDAPSNYTEMRTGPAPLDLVRLASVKRQNTPEKLQLDPECEFLLGGMPKGDQASTSKCIRAEDLARMSASEQVEWCINGGLREALGPDGDRTLLPAIKNILQNQQIAYRVRYGAFKAIASIGCPEDVKNSIAQIALDKQDHPLARYGAFKVIASIGCPEDVKNSIMQAALDKQNENRAYRGALKVIASIGRTEDVKSNTIQYNTIQ